MEAFSGLSPSLESSLLVMPQAQQDIHRAMLLVLLARPEIRDRIRQTCALTPAELRGLWEHVARRGLWKQAAVIWAKLSGQNPSDFVEKDRFDYLIPVFIFQLWVSERFPNGGKFSDPKHYPPTPEGEQERLRMIAGLEQLTGMLMEHAQGFARFLDNSG